MRKITRDKLALFLSEFATDKKVLDIGAGSTEYAQWFPNRVTLDIDAKRSPDVIGDITALPFEDNSFEVLICSEVFEHVKDLQKAVNEMHRVLSPNGLLIFSTRFVYPFHDAPNDYWRFTKSGLEFLFAGWKIEKCIPETNTFETLAVLLQRIIFQTTVHGGRLTKGILLFGVLIFKSFGWLVKSEYGDIRRTTPVDSFMTSGWYLAARVNKPHLNA